MSDFQAKRVAETRWFSAVPTLGICQGNCHQFGARLSPVGTGSAVDCLHIRRGISIAHNLILRNRSLQFRHARLSETTVRLLECLTDPAEARILGPQVVREITYRALCGQHGGALRAAAALHSRFGLVNRALQRIHAEYARDLSVEELADTAGMSPSAFHLNFKAVTSTSPLQYLKTIRLHKARMLMVYEGLRAGIAAERVGYESSSQFSREFKRLFGTSPLEEIEHARRMFGVSAPAMAGLE